MFSELALNDQLDGLFGSYEPLNIAEEGDLRTVAARVAGRRVVVVGSDTVRQRGSLGVREGAQIIAALNLAKLERTPVVFLLDTAGVRVTEGIAGVSSLRSCLRAALDAALDGVQMLALISRNCFGGASVLATICDRRIVNRSSLTGMSGPRLIEQMSGRADLDSTDPDAVRALLGGTARAAVSPGFVLIEDDPQCYREQLVAWLQTRTSAGIRSADIAPRLDELRDRLRALASVKAEQATLNPETSHLQAAADALLGTGTRLFQTGAFVHADVDTRRDVRLFGLAGGGLVGAEDILRLADAIARVPDSVTRLLILLDCESHSARARDERLVLSEFLGVLAIQIRMRHRQSMHIRVVVTGVSGGGAFAALSSAASTVCMLPSARLCVLPTAAMLAINKIEEELITTPQAAIAAGAVDEIFGAPEEVSANEL